MMNLFRGLAGFLVLCVILSCTVSGWELGSPYINDRMLYTGHSGHTMYAYCPLTTVTNSSDTQGGQPTST